MSLRYLSVCSGIEAATVAWRPLGFQAIAFAEIEPFPCAVLAHHYPDVPNRGDLTRFHEWPDAAVDVLVGGTPCQSFSVAGLRKGLADPRGNLALTFLAVADRYRPRWVVWENVPGVLSADSHDAPDPRPPADPVDLECDGQEVDVDDEYDADEVHAFACLLAGFSELRYRGAYATLDAQYFKLAQRRKRVFAVFHLGDWQRAAAVLFDRTSLSGHPAPSREAGQTVPTLASRSSAGGGLGTDFDCDGGLIHVPEIVPQAMSAKCAHPPAIAGCLDGRNAARPSGLKNEADVIVASGYGAQVRRLTPRECERLQGFPDDYTLVPYNGKPAKDGPRYKALGNSMPTTVMRWIGQRIALVESLT